MNWSSITRKVLSTPQPGTVGKRTGTFDITVPDADRYNHSTQYHHVLLEAVTERTQRALDIGCGEGLLTRQLARLVADVVGIDSDPTSIERARQQASDLSGLQYINGDAMTHSFDPSSFDIVTAVNVIHQVDLTKALYRMAELTKPGGVVAVIGVANRRRLADLPYDALMFAAHLTRWKPKNTWDHGAPVINPRESFAEIRRVAKKTLPGAHYKRRIYGRYTLSWSKPLQP